MYFPPLEELKGFKDSDLDVFDKLLFQIYEKRYHKRFNPKIYKYFEDITLDENKWISALEQLCELGYLIINFELCCPNSDETIDIFHNYDDIPLGSEKLCPDCDCEFEVDLHYIFITYTFNVNLEPEHMQEKTESSDEDFFRYDFRDNGQISLKYSLNDLILQPEIMFERLINERRDALKHIFDNAIDSSDPHEKGSLFEDLAEKLLDSYYLKFHRRNVRYPEGEIDLIFKVRKIQGTIFQDFSDMLIVECKNWHNKVGTNEIRIFVDKMNDVKGNVGIFISKSSITGHEFKDSVSLIKRKWDQEGKIVIDINIDDLKELIFNGLNLYACLEDKYYNVKCPLLKSS